MGREAAAPPLHFAPGPPGPDHQTARPLPTVGSQPVPVNVRSASIRWCHRPTGIAPTIRASSPLRRSVTSPTVRRPVSVTEITRWYGGPLVRRSAAEATRTTISAATGRHPVQPSTAMRRVRLSRRLRRSR